MGARNIATLLFFAVACSSTLDPGSVGTLRYAGRVIGVPPLALIPPVADPLGNLYVAYGQRGVPRFQLFVGAAGGGWSSSCFYNPPGAAESLVNRIRDDGIGVHGWAGFATSRQWLWTGQSLVAVSSDGNCHAVLYTDPATNADLQFQAVPPAVRNLSERTTLVAYVQAKTDPAPFTALVDLDTEILTNVQAFDPRDAVDAQVIGVGGVRTKERGIVLVQYRRGSSSFVELRGYDGDANETDRVAIRGGPFATYAVRGYLQTADDGLVAGLIDDTSGNPKLLTADSAGGDVVDVGTLKPVGVHLWGGSLWLVGTSQNQPVVAQIARGGIGQPTAWSASTSAAANFGGATAVRDDRSLPSRAVTWQGVKTGTGDFPFLSPHSLTSQAPNTALWIWAGPTDTQGIQSMTSFAVSPVGVTYP